MISSQSCAEMSTKGMDDVSWLDAVWEEGLMPGYGASTPGFCSFAALDCSLRCKLAQVYGVAELRFAWWLPDRRLISVGVCRNAAVESGFLGPVG